MAETVEPAAPLSGRTAWARNLEAPLRDFLRTETGSAAILLGAAIVALAWVNIDSASYERVWQTLLAIRIGGIQIQGKQGHHEARRAEAALRCMVIDHRLLHRISPDH